MEQIGRRIKENPAYFNQKIDELKDVYTQLFPRPMDPIVLDEWRDDLKIWMWNRVAALTPPTLTNLPELLYQNVMERVPDERLALNLSGLPEDALQNIAEMAIPPKWYEALNDRDLNGFISGDQDVPAMLGGYESFYDPSDLPKITMPDGKRLYVVANPQLVLDTAFPEFSDTQHDARAINKYFRDFKLKHDGVSIRIRRGDANFAQIADVCAQDIETLDEYYNDEYAEQLEQYRQHLQQVQLARMEAAEAALENEEDEEDEEDEDDEAPFEAEFNEFLELPPNIFGYDNITGRLFVESYRFGCEGTPLILLPLRGFDKKFMNFYIKSKLGADPPIINALPAEAQAAFNAVSN